MLISTIFARILWRKSPNARKNLPWIIVMVEYTNLAFRKILRQNGLHGFSDFWSLPENWYEKPNYRRRGWSGVSQHQLTAGTKSYSIFVKRQENHNYRSLIHPFGRPTFYKEYCHLMEMKTRKIPTAALVYYGERKKAGQYGAILVVMALAGYYGLDALLNGNKKINHMENFFLLEKIGMQIRYLHDHGFQHRALYGKHIMVNQPQNSDEVDIAFIDLEKTRHWPLMTVTLRACDLAQLLRHPPVWQPTMIKALLRGYLNDHPRWTTALITSINQRLRKKENQHGRSMREIIEL